MKSLFPVWIGLLVGLVGMPLCAQTTPGQQDAMQWLQRVANAAQTLSYSGTFVYRSGKQSETSRIVHLASNGNQSEKLEALDGSPREIVQQNDEVRCYLPESKLVIVEQRGAHRPFPALLPASLAGLNEHYAVRKGGRTRVAGFDSQVIQLDPLDSWRYGRKLWVDAETGLLLKAELLNERGEQLESLAFTELHIGTPASPDAVKPSFAEAASRKGAWQVRQTRTREMPDDARWLFRADLPGFRRQAAMLRNIADDPSKPFEVLHWVYSDGLSAISVFIQPLKAGSGGSAGFQAQGAFSVFKRVVDGNQVVVMGDVPPAAVRRFAEGIEVRAK